MSDKDADIFSSDKEQENNTSNENEEVNDVVDVFADKLMSITKEDGSPKYDTLEKALDALKASQEHIPVLEADNKQLKEQIEELNKAAERARELEELVKRMSGEQGNNEEKPESGNPADKGGLSEQEAADLVRKILNQEKQTENAVSNITRVQNTLIKKFGSEELAIEAIKSKTDELKVTPQQLKELSASNPEMVLALFGNGQSSQSVTTSSVNSSGMKPREQKLERPEASLLSGPSATDAKRKEYMRRIREEVYNRLKVEN